MYGVDWGSLRQLPADREINGLEEEQEVAETLSDVEVVRFAVFLDQSLLCSWNVFSY